MSNSIDLERIRKEVEQKLFFNETHAAEYQTDEVTRISSPINGNATATNYHSPDYSKFPELILLNQYSHHRAIFWFHSVGGVQPYFMFAENNTRPFYGIESRGLRTERAPLHGIQALAAYYVHIILSVQPSGPYDLGGYSLGGVIAYEVARQLQELGEKISSITMLDTLDQGVSHVTKNISFKSRLLQGVNHTLAANVFKDSDRLKTLLINRDEINWKMSEKKIIKRLTQLACERVAFSSEEQMKRKILKMAQLQLSYEYENYSILPLSRPDEVDCYFFRNSSGILFGDLSPFFWILEDEVNVDHLVYWKLWEKHLPKIHVMDLNSSSHMTILTEEKAYKPIIEFCKQLYSEEGITESYLTYFKERLGMFQMMQHGMARSES